MARRRRTAALFEVIHRGRPLASQKEPGGILASVGSVFRTSDTSACEASAPAIAPPNLQAVSRSVDLDEDRQQVAFRVSYTAAATVVFALVTIVGVAFIAGRKTIPGIHSASAVNNVDPRLGPVQVDVTDLPRTPVKLPATARPAVESTSPARPSPGTPELKPEPPSTGGNIVNGRIRKVGYQYVVIQSYPEQKLAEEARKVLMQNQIDCTVEQNLHGWNGWFCVLGTKGFERLSNNPQYEAYIRKIRQISATYAKKGSFREFAPTATRWDPKRK